MELGAFVKRWDLKKENNMRWENEKNGYLFSFIKEGILIQTFRNCCAPCEGTIKLEKKLRYIEFEHTPPLINITT